MNSHPRRGCVIRTTVLSLVLLTVLMATPAFADTGILDKFREKVVDIYGLLEIVLGLTILGIFIFAGVRAVRKGEVSDGVIIIGFGIVVIIAFYLVAEQFNFSNTPAATASGN